MDDEGAHRFDDVPRVDQRSTFDAAVQQARGALLEAQGKYANATTQRARTEELTKTLFAEPPAPTVRLLPTPAAETPLA